MSTLRVAYVCADPGVPVFGTKGASVHLQELVRAWRARGAQVEVYAVRRGSDIPPDLEDLPVQLVTLAGSSLEPAAREVAQQRAAKELADLVVAAEPDVIHERYSLFSTLLARVRALQDERAGRSTLVLEVNAPLVEEQRTHRVLVDEAAAERALLAQLQATDVVACVSEPVADWVRTRVGTGARAAVVVTPNGVNTDRIRPIRSDPGPAPVVVFTGTLKPWHGVEDLVRAAALAEQRWQVRLVGDGPERDRLTALAARHGVALELVGPVPPQEIPQALAGAAVAVAPYPQAGDHYFSPLKVYEYAAAGLPVVASRIGQLPWVVEHGRTGLLVPPSDPGALATAIDELVADPVRAQAMGAAGRARMERGHTWGHVLAAMIEPVADQISARGSTTARKGA